MCPYNTPEENAEYFSRWKKNNRRISISFTHDEWTDIENNAREEGMKTNAFIKALSLYYKQRNLSDSENKKNDLKECIFLLRNIANNINQIAYQTNRDVLEGKEPTEQETTLLLKSILSQLQKTEKDIKQKFTE